MKKLITLAVIAAATTIAAFADTAATQTPGFGKCAPWDTYVSSVRALFGGDEAVNVVFDRPAKTLTLYVAGDEKCNAIDKLMPDVKDFGGFVMKIRVVPANGKLADENPVATIEAAFKGNPAISRVVCLSNVFTRPIVYVEFENRVVQYWDDDLSSLEGLRSTLFETLAEEVLDPEATDGCVWSTARPVEAAAKCECPAPCACADCKCPAK